jgi:hypothetical protein
MSIVFTDVVPDTTKRASADRATDALDNHYFTFGSVVLMSFFNASITRP